MNPGSTNMFAGGVLMVRARTRQMIVAFIVLVMLSTLGKFESETVRVNEKDPPASAGLFDARVKTAFDASTVR